MSNPPRKVIHLPKVRMLRGRAPVRLSSASSTGYVKPPDPDALRKQEEERLRSQLQKEIVSRSRTCAYKGYNCTMPVLSGRQHCVRHILHDPTAPYIRCAQERCTMPVKKDESEHHLCFEHARAAMLARQRSAAPPPPVTTTETLLNQLQHYIRPERTRTTSCTSSVSVVSDPNDQEITPAAVDPFKQIDATSVNAAYSTAIMECASASDSDGDSVVLDPDAGWGEDLSDPEEAPCEDQPLWRAGVYTAEEAVCEARNAMKTLQSAYIKQMGRLKQLLQTARLQYVRTLKAEKEQYCSIYNQSMSGPLSVKERRQLRKLKAYASYRRKHGMDAVLARKLHHKRAKANEPPRPSTVPSGARCTFSEYNVRCALAALPAAKHCLKHIVLDRQQVLFAACGDQRGGVPCREPVARLPLPSAHCRYHTNPPHYMLFTLKKDNSDSDTESNASTDSQMTVTAELPSEGMTTSDPLNDMQFG